MMTRILWGALVALAISWTVIFAIVVIFAVRSALRWREIVRLIPDTMRLIRRLATDREVPAAARLVLWVMFVYFISPFDLIPEFIPVIGYADDALLAILALRLAVHFAGLDVIGRNWPGSDEGLAVLLRAARIKAP